MTRAGNDFANSWLNSTNDAHCRVDFGVRPCRRSNLSAVPKVRLSISPTARYNAPALGLREWFCGSRQPPLSLSTSLVKPSPVSGATLHRRVGPHQLLREVEMGMKLYVGNLTYGVTDAALEQMFTPHGAVKSAQVVMDRDTGRSKGFGFV